MPGIEKLREMDLCMAGGKYILTEWPRIKMTSEVLFQHREKWCPQNRNDTVKQILKAWIMLQKKIATDGYVGLFFFPLQTLSSTQALFKHTFQECWCNQFFVVCLVFSLSHPRILKRPSVFQCLSKPFTSWDITACLCKLEMDEMSRVSLEQLQIIKAEMKTEYSEKTILTSSCCSK